MEINQPPPHPAGFLIRFMKDFDEFRKLFKIESK